MELYDLAEQQYGLVTRRQARELGVRLAPPHWEACSTRVLRASGSSRTDKQRLMAAVLDAGPGAVVSHGAAAWLWQIPGFGMRVVDVSRPRRRSRRPSILAVVHEPRLLPVGHCAAVDGIPVTTAERTLCDVAATARRERTERAVDSALARQVVDLGRLWLTFGDLTARGRPGRTRMGLILADRQPGYIAPESELEARFIELIAAAGLAPPERQVDVGGPEWVGRVDFLYRRARLVVELDGRLGHSSLLDRAADVRRDRALHAAGFEVLRFGWADVVLHPHRTVAQLRAALAVAPAA